MSMPLLGQFDPEFTRYMNEVMVLLRQLFQTQNHWALLVDGTARAGIEAILVSLLEPGERVLVPVFGRFGHLLGEIAGRCGAEVRCLDTAWGSVFPPEQIEAAIRQHRPRVVAVVHGDTSTTMAQPLADLGAMCQRYDALLYVDATATVGGMDLPVDAWQLDAVSAGLQKCLSGPSGSAPITFNERVAEVVKRRQHIERGIQPAHAIAGVGRPIQSNYFDLPMLMEYWSPRRLNHHTEATSMLYAARECVRLVLQEGLQPCFARHTLASQALGAGLQAMGLEMFGDQRYKMPNVTGVIIPPGIDGEAVRHSLLQDFGIEIGTSFGPLHGRIWRIGTMGYNCRKPNVLLCLAGLEAALRQQRFLAPAGAAVDAALHVYRDAGQ
jgi:(S)-ureidoglycine-glyoxylate aminotransferase